jgi:hypothetical protein
MVHTIWGFHKNNIVYWDFKAKNILVLVSERKCMLGDLGGAKFIWKERKVLVMKF